jgi:DNA-binding response OmpR family regulator
MNSWYIAPPKVLVADDDHDLLSLVSFVFRNAGYEITSVSNGVEALAAFERERFSVLVLDINMPAPNGLQVCSSIRKRSNTPILILSARDQEQDLLQALEAGADAYMVKPFSPRSLIARVHALVRRATSDDLNNEESSTSARVDMNELALRYPGGSVSLTKLEARVLRLLIANAGTTVTAADLVMEVWNAYSAASRNMLKQIIFRLRQKLSSSPYGQDFLKTAPGGYLWIATPTSNSSAKAATEVATQ